jgi:hypothetical protein
MTDEEYRDAAQDAARAKSATAPPSVAEKAMLPTKAKELVQRLHNDEVVDRVIDELLFEIDSETYVGIHRAGGQRWIASVYHAGTTLHFGQYDDALDAARARDKGMIKLRGWDADNLNFPAADYRGDEEFCRMVSTMTDVEYRAAAQDAARARNGTVRRSFKVGARGQLPPASPRESSQIGVLKSRSSHKRKLVAESVKVAARDAERVREVKVRKVGEKYAGVSLNKLNKEDKWIAQVWHASTSWYFGSYVDQLDAARARDKGMIKLKGWDADKLNFPAADYRGDKEFCRMVSTMTDEEYRDAVRDAARTFVQPVIYAPPRQKETKTEKLAKNDPWVGERVRKWFPKQKAYYEGVIAKAHYIDGEVYYFIEYDDGDEEDLSKDDLRAGQMLKKWKSKCVGGEGPVVKKRYGELVAVKLQRREEKPKQQRRVYVEQRPLPPPPTKEAVAKLLADVRAAAEDEANNPTRGADALAARRERERALANPVGGVVLGRPQPPPAEDAGEIRVLSHVLSPAVAKEFKRVHFMWKHRHGLLDAAGSGKMDLFKAIAATVRETRVVAINSFADNSNEVIRRFDASAALAEAFARQLVAATTLTMTDAAAAAIDLPETLDYCDGVEAFTIGDDDPRVILRGELGARATRRIPAGTLLGPHAAYACARVEYHSRKFCVPVHGARRALDPSVRYTTPLHAELDHDAFAADFLSVAGTELEESLGGIIADAYGYGNLASAVNDPAIDPFDVEGTNDELRVDTGVVNVHLVEIVVHDFPFMFHVAVNEIKEGEELLTEQGQYFWEMIRSGRRRIAAVSGGRMGALS